MFGLVWSISPNSLGPSLSDLADILVKNLTISNKELQFLLHNHAHNRLLNMAKDNLINPVDYDAPVFIVVKPRKSYFQKVYLTKVTSEMLKT